MGHRRRFGNRRHGPAHRVDLVPGRRVASVTIRVIPRISLIAVAGPAPTERGKENVMKRSLSIVEGVLFVALSLIPAVLPTVTFAQDDDKSVKQDVKDAGHSTKQATKKTAHKVKKDTKKVVNKSA